MQEKLSIYVIDIVEQSMKNQKLHEITKIYGKVIDQKIRKDSNRKRGNTQKVQQKKPYRINQTNK